MRGDKELIWSGLTATRNSHLFLGFLGWLTARLLPAALHAGLACRYLSNVRARGYAAEKNMPPKARRAAGAPIALLLRLTFIFILSWFTAPSQVGHKPLIAPGKRRGEFNQETGS